jgi:hypothetical protein
MYFGEVSGIAVNSKKHIFILSRGNTQGPAYGAAATQLLEFDADGSFLREIGKGLYAWAFAHTVRIDPEDNIWVTDKGSDMVVKFRPDGRVAMVWGRKPEASDEGAEPLKHPMPPLPAVKGLFRQVTDVAWDRAGNAYISDGYINSRVAKIDKDGNWAASYGEYGTGPGQFRTLHSIASDAQDNIYIADRGNARIQVMSPSGAFQRTIKIDVPFDYDKARTLIRDKPPQNAEPGTFSPGAPWALCITPGPNQVLFVADAFPGRIYKLSLDGSIDAAAAPANIASSIRAPSVARGASLDPHSSHMNAKQFQEMQSETSGSSPAVKRSLPPPKRQPCRYQRSCAAAHLKMSILRLVFYARTSLVSLASWLTFPAQHSSIQESHGRKGM